MGQSLGKATGDTRYFAPQVLKGLETIDLKKLKKLIRKKHLAPCYPGLQEPDNEFEHEECPICFLHYPALNTSECCSQRICTECILKVQVAAIDPWPCPFCKSPDYTVKFTGPKTKEEKDKDYKEHQKVLEARARERQDEIMRDQARELERFRARQTDASHSLDQPGSASAASPLSTSSSITNLDCSPAAVRTQEMQLEQHLPSQAAANVPDGHPQPYTLEAFLPATLSNMVDNLDQLNDYMLNLALCNSVLEAPDAPNESVRPADAAPCTDSSHMQGELAAPSEPDAARTTNTPGQNSAAWQLSKPGGSVPINSSQHLVNAQQQQQQQQQQCQPGSSVVLQPHHHAADTVVPDAASCSTAVSTDLPTEPSCYPISASSSQRSGSEPFTIPLLHLMAQAAAAGEPPAAEKVHILGMIAVRQDVSAANTAAIDTASCDTAASKHSTRSNTGGAEQAAAADAPGGYRDSCCDHDDNQTDPTISSTALGAILVRDCDDTKSTAAAPKSVTTAHQPSAPHPSQPAKPSDADNATPPVPPVAPESGTLVATVLDDPHASASAVTPMVIENPDGSFFVVVPSDPMQAWEMMMSSHSTSEDIRLMKAIAGGDQLLLDRAQGRQNQEGQEGGLWEAATGAGEAAGCPVGVDQGASGSGGDGSSSAVGGMGARCEAQGSAGPSGSSGYQSAGDLDFMERMRRADAAYAAAIAQGDKTFTSGAFGGS